MPLTLRIILIVYCLLAVTSWLLVLGIRFLYWRNYDSRFLEERILLPLRNLKPLFSKAIPATFGTSILVFLLAFRHDDPLSRQGFFFTAGIVGLTSLYMAALWSLPKPHREIQKAEVENKDIETQAELITQKHQPSWEEGIVSNYSEEKMRKTRRSMIIGFFLFVPASLGLTYLVLKAMGASDNEAAVFTSIFFILSTVSWIWNMGKYGARKKQIEERFRKTNE